MNTSLVWGKHWRGAGANSFPQQPDPRVIDTFGSRNMAPAAAFAPLPGVSNRVHGAAPATPGTRGPAAPASCLCLVAGSCKREAGSGLCAHWLDVWRRVCSPCNVKCLRICCVPPSRLPCALRRRFQGNRCEGGGGRGRCLQQHLAAGGARPWRAEMHMHSPLFSLLRASAASCNNLTRGSFTLLGRPNMAPAAAFAPLAGVSNRAHRAAPATPTGRGRAALASSNAYAFAMFSIGPVDSWLKKGAGEAGLQRGKVNCDASCRELSAER